MSQGDIVKIIPAGFQNFEMRVGGDFVFIKECARDVVVTIEDKATKMIRGDKRRVERKEPSTQAFASFQVSNNYDFDLRVVFVVGEGDFNSQIVTGEVILSSYVKTAKNGVSKTVASPVHKKFRITREGELTHISGDLLFNHPVYGEKEYVDAGYRYTSGLTYWNGSYYALNVYSDYCVLVSYSEQSLVSDLDSEVYIANKFSEIGQRKVRGIAFDERGNLYADYDGDLYLKRMGSNIFSKIKTGAFSSYYADRRSVTNMQYSGGYLYVASYYNGNTSSFDRGYTKNDFESYCIESGDVNRISLLSLHPDQLHNVGTVIKIVGSKLFMRGAYFYHEYSLRSGDVKYLGITDMRAGIGRADVLLSDDLAYLSYDDGSLKITHFKDLKTYGEVEFSDDVSAVKIGLTSQPNVIKRMGRSVYGYDFVSLFCKKFLALDDYQDRVTSVTYNDGIKQILTDSGTATFALRDVDLSYIEVVSGSEFSLSYLTNA